MASLTYMQMGIGKIARHFTSLSLHRTVDSLSLFLEEPKLLTSIFDGGATVKRRKGEEEEKREEDTFPYYYTKEEWPGWHLSHTCKWG